MGDTVSSRAIAPLAAGCDVMAHEATFAAGMEQKARIAQHSTGAMAGAFAAAVGARALVLTHFSARYREAPVMRVRLVGRGRGSAGGSTGGGKPWLWLGGDWATRGQGEGWAEGQSRFKFTCGRIVPVSACCS